MNIENRHIDSFNFFYELVKSVDEFLNNHIDITFNNFLMKEFIMLSYHRRRSLDFLIHNNLAERK